MIVIRTKSGTEIRIPVNDLDTITEIEPATGLDREVPPHPYLHREGVNRCAACWQDRLHPSHADAGA